ncbi:MAG: hypothetical protein ACREM2_05980 [Vulcanimicrobiaceae bacterium]
MSVAALGSQGAGTLSPAGLFGEGLRVMRERLGIYLALAALCGASAYAVFARVNLLRVFAGGDPTAPLRTPPINVVLLAALLALFFVLPSALRRLDADFRMTLPRACLMVALLVAIGAVTELGYAAAIVPGIVLGVLLSQTLIAALLARGERAGLRGLGTTMLGASGRSIALVRGHFATTLTVIAASLALLGVPFVTMLLALLVLDVIAPPSLVVTAPLLFLTFIYFECVRYVLIVRWYRRLEGPPAPGR